MVLILLISSDRRNESSLDNLKSIYDANDYIMNKIRNTAGNQESNYEVDVLSENFSNN